MVPYSCVLCGCLCRRMRKGGGLLQCFWAHSLAIYLINNSYHIPHSFSSLKPTMRKYSYAYLWIGFKLNDSPSQNFLCVCLSVHPLASLEVKLIRYFSMFCWFIPKLVNFRVEIAKNNIFWKSNSKCRFTWALPPYKVPWGSIVSILLTLYFKYYADFHTEKGYPWQNIPCIFKFLL